MPDSTGAEPPQLEAVPPPAVCVVSRATRGPADGPRCGEQLTLHERQGAGLQRVLVTGGAGFIGSRLAQRLVELGVDTTVLDDLSSGRRENVPQGAAFVEASVLDREAVGTALERVDVCFHLAAIASVSRCTERLVESHAVNLGGFINVLDAARRGAPYVIYASSAAVYGDSDAFPLREDGAVQPLSAYGADKLGCELHARVAHGVYGVSSTGFRFFNVFGPGQDPGSPYSGVISRLAERLSRGEGVRIDGDGLQTRDFVYVDDVVNGLVAAARRRLDGAEVFNLCSATETSIVDLAKTMATVFDRPLDVHYGPRRAGDIRRSLGSRARFDAVFGRTATRTLTEGLEALRRSLCGESATPD